MSNRIRVERGDSSSPLFSFANVLKDIRALGVADNIKLTELTIGQAPFTRRFYRLFPYDRENLQTTFDLESYRKETEILSDFFSNIIGDPNKSRGSIVYITIKDYRGQIGEKLNNIQVIKNILFM